MVEDYQKLNRVYSSVAVHGQINNLFQVRVWFIRVAAIISKGNLTHD